jgi:cell division protein FtsW (lipid II flippase)
MSEIARAADGKRTLGRLRPHPRARRRELGLLAAASVALLVGWLGLAWTQSGSVAIGNPSRLLVYMAALFVVHLVFVIAGRQTDQILLPVVGMLGGLSLLLMERLPQGLAAQRIGGTLVGLAGLQLAWLLLGLAALAAVALLLRNDGWLRYYRYTWAAVGIVLLLAVFVFGRVVNGARLTLPIGPFGGQPSELLKVILVIFLAAYLADNRVLLARSSLRLGPLRLPPLPYLLPMLAMWGIAMAVVIVQKDLGAALLYFSVFLALLYVATRRLSYQVLGLALFIVGAAVLYTQFGHVRTRVDIWIDPWSDADGAGYQVIRGLYAFGRGGIVGTGLGAGLPQVGNVLAIPAIHTDFVFAGLAEELGLLGGLAICGLYLVVAERGLRIAARAADEFQALLAAGLTLMVVLQAALIIAGNLKLVPLTGVTLPFISYGGSSMLTNALAVGLLLALSDRGSERVVPPTARPQRDRVEVRRQPGPAPLGQPGSTSGGEPA